MADKLTPSDVKGLFEKLSNWGRWGKEDQRGALNFITNQKRAAAARLVQTGESVSMALPLATIPAPDNPNPVTHLMVQAGADSHEQALPYSGDYFAIAPHGMANTHIDALCHVFWQNKMYNGFDASEVGSHGAKKCAIDVTRAGIVSRGVLLDIPRLKKIEWMEPGEKILPEDLDAAEKAQKVHVEEGDVLMIRTGRAAMRKVKGGWDPMRVGLPGLDASLPAMAPRAAHRSTRLRCGQRRGAQRLRRRPAADPRRHAGRDGHPSDRQRRPRRGVVRLRETRAQRVHVLDGAANPRAWHRVAGKSARDLLISQ